ncbi:hypothetical protein BGX23_001546, partial [Mortierella sp. AD031]
FLLSLVVHFRPSPSTATAAPAALVVLDAAASAVLAGAITAAGGVETRQESTPETIANESEPNGLDHPPFLIQGWQYQQRRDWDWRRLQ